MRRTLLSDWYLLVWPSAPSAWFPITGIHLVQIVGIFDCYPILLQPAPKQETARLLTGPLVGAGYTVHILEDQSFPFCKQDPHQVQSV